MHFANTPTVTAVANPVLLKEFVGDRSAEALWSAWMDHLIGKLTPTLTQMAQKAKLALQQCSVRAKRSAITSYVGYCTILTQRYLRCFQRCKDQAAPADLLSSILSAVDKVSALTDDSSIVSLYPPVQLADDAAGLSSIRVLRSVCDQLILLAVSVLQQRGWVFDLMSPKYATLTVAQMEPILNRLSSTTHLQRLPSLAAELFVLYTSTLDAAKIPESVDRLGFVMVAPTDEEKLKGQSKTQWIFVKRAYHQAWTAMVTEKLWELCTAAKTVTALTPIAERAWAIVRTRYLPSSSTSSTAAESDASKLLDLPVFSRFLSACAALAPVIAAREQPLLLSALVHHLRAPDSRFTVPSGVTRMEGWASFLMQAIDACSSPTDWPSRQTWLSSISDISLPAVRECMQQACHDRDPQVRLQHYLSILRVSAATSVREWALSVEFVQKRTKNEAGLYRKEIYRLLQEQMSTKVSQSLGLDTASAGTRSDGSVASSLTSVQIITDSLSSILRDDVSKRDSVAKNLFQLIGRTLIISGISIVRPPLLPIRRLWLSCGIALDWLILRTISGEDAIRKWVWPITGVTVSQKHTITEAVLEGQMREVVSTGIKGGENVFCWLRETVYRGGLHVHVAPEDVFTPEKAVDLLTSTFLAIQQQSSGDDKSLVSSSSSSDPLTGSSARPLRFSSGEFLLSNGGTRRRASCSLCGRRSGL